MYIPIFLINFINKLDDFGKPKRQVANLHITEIQGIRFNDNLLSQILLLRTYNRIKANDSSIIALTHQIKKKNVSNPSN